MKRIFERGSFKGYSITTSQLNETLTATRRFSEGGLISRNTTVFLSHKHSDLEDLKGIIGFLHSFGVDVYIDSMDKNMPEETNKDTAARIKQIIRKCDRFILLAISALLSPSFLNSATFLCCGGSCPMASSSSLLQTMSSSLSGPGLSSHRPLCRIIL